MKNIFAFVLLITVTLFTLPVMGNSINKKVVTEDSNWLIHLDARNLRKTSMYNYLINNQFKLIVKNVEQKVKQDFGFNVKEDIYGITLYGNGFIKEDIVIHVSGKLNQKKIIKGMKEDGIRLTHSKYKGRDIYGAQEFRFFTFLPSDGVVIARTERRVKEVIDYLGNSKGTESFVLKKVLELPNEAFLIGAADNLPQLSGIDNRAVILKKARFAAFMLGEKTGKLKMKVSVYAVSEEVANQIEQIVKGVIAFGSMQIEESKGLQEMLKHVVVTREGKVVHLNISMDANELMSYVILKVMGQEKES